MAIVFGALAGNLGEKKPHLTGNGRLVNDGNKIAPRPPMKPTFALLCTGLIISLAFYELGALCHRYISVIPTYAWMIIAVVLVKGTGIMSEELEDAAREWGHFAIHQLDGCSADPGLVRHSLTLRQFSAQSPRFIC